MVEEEQPIRSGPQSCGTANLTLVDSRLLCVYSSFRMCFKMRFTEGEGEEERGGGRGVCKRGDGRGEETEEQLHYSGHGSYGNQQHARCSATCLPFMHAKLGE